MCLEGFATNTPTGFSAGRNRDLALHSSIFFIGDVSPVPEVFVFVEIQLEGLKNLSMASSGETV